MPNSRNRLSRYEQMIYSELPISGHREFRANFSKIFRRPGNSFWELPGLIYPCESSYFVSTPITRISGNCIFQFAGIASKISLKSCPSPAFKGAALTGWVST